MMDVALSRTAIAPMTADAIASVAAIEEKILACPQMQIHTHHVLHGGMYARTILIPAGVILTGALVKIPTMLFISGDALVSRGQDQGLRITGSTVLPASAGRKQAFLTYQDTTVSMVFPTDATTIEEAEVEFTDDADILASRRDAELNTEIITGE